jgi:hypothetical protein
MTRLMRSCGVAALLGMFAGQGFAETQGGFVRTVPVMAAPAPMQDGPTEAEGPLPPGVLPGTLDAQLARLTAGEDTDQPRLILASNAARPQRRSERTEAAPSFGFAASLYDAAGAFDDYTSAAGALGPRFADAAAVNRAVVTGSSYEPAQLEAGAVAYAALIALRDPAFVARIQAAAERSPDLAEALIASPDTVLEVAGDTRAAAAATAALKSRAEAVAHAGRGVKQAAYDVQHQAWSRGFVADPQAVLVRVKTDSHQVSRADHDALRRLYRSVSNDQAADGGAPSELVIHGLALAALAVLGRAGDDDVGSLQNVLAVGLRANCLHMAKLNLYQCMAVAGPQYEDLYCVGQHGMIDTGGCFVKALNTIPAAAPAMLAATGSEAEYSERAQADRGYAAAPMR